MEGNKDLALAWKYVEETGSHLFLTGKAGTGKTTFLHNIRSRSGKRIVVVAPTGVAAINARGVTIHSFFQLPFGPILPNSHQLTEQRKFRKDKINILKSMDLLVIDEVSMVRADVLDGIDAVLRRYRDKNKVFGGVQVLLIGDLQQLAPVVKPHEWDLLREYYKTAYFFSSNAFQEANVVPIELKKIFRQSNEEFVQILNEMRNNKISETSLQRLNEHYLPEFEPSEGEGYITLTTHNRNADAINNKKLEALEAETKSYYAKVQGDFNEGHLPNDELLKLKEGAQVMFIKNDSSPEKNYYNGKIGIVKELTVDSVFVVCGEEVIEARPETWENIKYSLDKESMEVREELAGSFTQIPLRLAWAITIHKSQGLTFEKAIIDAEFSFAHGQTYVALSRCTSLEGVVLRTPIKPTSIINDATIDRFNKEVEETAPTEKEWIAARKTYQLTLLTELFDFRPLSYPLHRLLREYKMNATSVLGNAESILNRMNNEGVNPLIGVGENFIKQLYIMSKSVENLEEDVQIQERYAKAVAYFHSQIKEYISEPLSELNFSIENRSVKNEFEKHLEAFEEILRLKTTCFDEMHSFSSMQYLRLRSKVVTEEKKKKTKKRNEYTTQHTELFEALRVYRYETAEAQGIPPFQIFTQKSLYELCEKLPVTTKQLLSVHGFGKTRVKKYGDDIIEIIQNYCKKEQIEVVVEETPTLEIPKQNTRELSFALYQEGLSVEEIAERRGLVSSTIMGHLEEYVLSGDIPATNFISEERLERLEEIISTNEFSGLTELKSIVGDDFSYPELRLAIKLREKQ